MKWVHVTIVCFLIFCYHTLTWCHVLNVTEKNIHKLLDKRKFLLVLVTKPKCMPCNWIFPRFWAASQSYDQDVIFGRIRSKQMAQAYGVEYFPTLGYFTAGNKKMAQFQGDITIDTIVDLIADKLGADFAYVMKQYTTQLDSYNFDGVISSWGLHAFVLLYDKKDDYYEKFEDLAKVYKNDEEVSFLRLDVRSQPTLKRNFDVVRYPTVYWVVNSDNSMKKRYGGTMQKLEVMGFVEDRVGIRRSKDGSLPPDAGRIAEFDQLISENIETIRSAKDMGDLLEEAKKLTEKNNENEFANYYMYLLEMVADHGRLDTLQDERMSVLKSLAHVEENVYPKTVNYYTQRKNIITQLIDELGRAVFQKLRNQFVHVDDIKERKEYERKLPPAVEIDDEEDDIVAEKPTIHRHEEL